VAILSERIALLRELARQAAPLVPAVVQRQQQRFLDRWREALAAAGAGSGVSAEALQERALSEAASYALRIDVAEELSRLGAHLDEITRLLAKGGELGKRLDFLIQELHREAQYPGRQVIGPGADQSVRRDEGRHRADARAGAEHRIACHAIRCCAVRPAGRMGRNWAGALPGRLPSSARQSRLTRHTSPHLLYILVLYIPRGSIMANKTAKLFVNGGSQAVRLPAEFRFDSADEVFIRRDAVTGDVILSAGRTSRAWRQFFALRDQAAVPGDFMAERAVNTPLKPREIFEGR
jgi:virulence-associated protein VagC